jgi:hypothetical protein
MKNRFINTLGIERDPTIIVNAASLGESGSIIQKGPLSGSLAAVPMNYSSSSICSYSRLAYSCLALALGEIISNS